MWVVGMIFAGKWSSSIAYNMIEAINLIEIPSFNTISIIGFIIVFSYLSSRLFKKFEIPQIVGFITTGIIISPSFLNIVPPDLSKELVFISQIALGLMGFDIGSHLKATELRSMRKIIASILFSEVTATLTIVTISIYLFTRDLNLSLIFGSIATATAPAATVEVIAEYDAKGPLTTSILAVIGLDNAFALVLYYLTAGIVESNLKGLANITIIQILVYPTYQIIGSIVLGIILSIILDTILQRIQKEHDAMAFSLGFILFTVGIAIMMNFSLILSTLTMGFVLINRSPEHGYKIRHTIEQAGPVVYVLFFTLIGAKFNLSILPLIGVIGIIYIITRIIGKYAGARIGGKISDAEPKLCNNIGLGLLTQAGAAAGLALETYNRFILMGPQGEALAITILNVITASIFIFEIIGPISCKFALQRARETGKARGTLDDWASEGP